MHQSFLRLPEVIQRTGFSRSRIYALKEQGEFPQPIKIGARAIAWLEAEVSAWIESRVTAARNQSPKN